MNFEERQKERWENAKRADRDRNSEAYNWMGSVSKFRMRVDSNIEPMATRGTIVYRFIGYDYGCARADERRTGIPCESVTLNPDGSAPAFVVPYPDLEAPQAE